MSRQGRTSRVQIRADGRGGCILTAGVHCPQGIQSDVQIYFFGIQASGNPIFSLTIRVRMTSVLSYRLSLMHICDNSVPLGTVQVHMHFSLEPIAMWRGDGGGSVDHLFDY